MGSSIDRGLDPAQRPPRRSTIVVAALTCVALAFVAYFERGAIQRTYQRIRYQQRLGIRPLIRTANDLPYRTVAGQLAGGFAHRPRRPPHRGADDQEAQNAAWKVYASAATLTAAADDRTSADARHAIGIAHLAAGNIDRACDELEAAVKSATDEVRLANAFSRAEDPSLLSDLAAAYYERGMRDERVELVLTAIDVSARARELDPGLAAAAFNHALAVEAVHLPAQAVAAWNAFLELDGTSGWADEARAHVKQLSSTARPAVQRLEAEAEATRIESELLPSWADSFRRGDARAADGALREAERIAASLHSCCRNAFHPESVRIVAKASQSDRRLAERLALAHQQYREARRLYAANETSRAAVLFESSRDAFVDASDVFALKPWKYVAASQLYLGDTKAALREIGAALDFCASNQACDGAARAHLLWVQAISSGRAGDPQGAIGHYTDALRGFEQGGEMKNAASIRALIAENMEFLGVGERAWPHRLAALRAAHESGTLDRIYIAFDEAASAALRRGHRVSASLFQDVVVDAARRERNTVLLSDALLWRARIDGRPAAEARRDLDEAGRLAASVADLQRRNRLAANIAAARGAFEPPGRAAELLTTALRYFEATDDHYRLADLYATRAAAHEKSGLHQLAEADYGRCIEELEAERSAIGDSVLRERFFSGGSSIFDRVLTHFWTTGRRADAFRVAEQSRGRELGDAVTAPPMTIDAVAVSLRENEAILEYAILDDRVAVFVVRREGTSFVEIPAGTSRVERLVAEMQDALDRGVSADASLEELATLLYEPVARAVGRTKRLVVVANKSLRGVPFAALRRPGFGRYLVQDHEIVIAPSAAAYVRAVRRDASLRRDATGRVLIASYGAGDASRGLPRLENGPREVVMLRTLYGEVDVLDAAQATPPRVLSAARDATVVHVIAHGVANREHPEYSSLVLAQSEEGSDLYAKAIASSSFRRTRFVFLSSCGATGRAETNDAPLTLPESFVAAGVPLVVGSVRPVDDAASAAFAASLHRAFAASGDAVAALRAAQLECLASPERRDPRFWSPWIAVGGAV